MFDRSSSLTEVLDIDFYCVPLAGTPPGVNRYERLTGPPILFVTISAKLRREFRELQHLSCFADDYHARDGWCRRALIASCATVVGYGWRGKSESQGRFPQELFLSTAGPILQMGL